MDSGRAAAAMSENKRRGTVPHSLPPTFCLAHMCVAEDAQDPALDFTHGALIGPQIRVEVCGKVAVLVGVRQPRCDAVGVVLVIGAGLSVETTTPERRIDFGNGRASRRYIPAIERPEMHARPEFLADEA
jgi:hypothetical protein